MPPDRRERRRSSWPLTGFFAHGAGLLAGRAPSPCTRLPSCLPRRRLRGRHRQPGEYIAVTPAIVEEIFAEGGPLHAAARPDVRAAQRAGRHGAAGDAGTQRRRPPAGRGRHRHGQEPCLPAAVGAVGHGQRRSRRRRHQHAQLAGSTARKRYPAGRGIAWRDRGLPPLRAALLKGRQHYSARDAFTNGAPAIVCRPSS